MLAQFANALGEFLTAGRRWREVQAELKTATDNSGNITGRVGEASTSYVAAWRRCEQVAGYLDQLDRREWDEAQRLRALALFDQVLAMVRDM